MCGGEGFVHSPPYSANLPLVPFLSAFCMMITNQHLINNRDFLGDVPSLVFHSRSPHMTRFLCIPRRFQIFEQAYTLPEMEEMDYFFIPSLCGRLNQGLVGGNAFLYSVDPIDSRGDLKAAPLTHPQTSLLHTTLNPEDTCVTHHPGDSLLPLPNQPAAGPITNVNLAEPPVIRAVRFSKSDK